MCTASHAVDIVPLRAERVALFKNGYSQVSLKGELPAGKQFELKGLPVPVEGTLWWEAPEGVKVLQVEGSIRERDVPTIEYTPVELLSANIGKQVRLTMSGGQTYEGVLVRSQLPPSMELTYTNHRGSVQQQQLSQQAPVFLKTAADEYLNIDLTAALSIDFSEQPNTPTRKELQPLMTMELGQPSPGSVLQVECLADGLSWTPTYRIDLGEKYKAHLECKAVIVNDMVDLDGVYLELITGHPDLGSDGLPHSTLTRLSSMANSMDNHRLSRRMMAPAPYVDSDDDDSDMASEPAPSRTRTEELYHYAIPDFSAKKNSTVAREIFSQSIDCRHVYTCHVRSSSNNGEDLPVWHCLRLKNESSWPWSPGTVVCYAGGRLLARGALKATGTGQETLLRLATTLDVKATQREILISRKPFAEQGDDETPKHGERSDKGKNLISVYQGEISLHNSADHEIDLELTKYVRGRITQAVEGGQISASPHESRILWILHLAPGESKVCTYTYED